MRNALKLAGLCCAGGALFIWGLAAGHFHVFPYDLLVGAYRRMFNDGGAVSEWTRARDGEERVQDQIERLRALGYLAGTEAATATETGVVFHDDTASQPGLMLYNSGHAPTAYLTDVEGDVLYEWNVPYGAAFPEDADSQDHRGGFWRRFQLLDDGSVIGVFEGLGIFKADRWSNVLWSLHNSAHHDLDVAPNGYVYVLTRIAHVVPAIDPRRALLEDFVTVLSPDGRPVAEYSLLDAVLNSEYSHLMDRVRFTDGDIFHTNSLQILDGAHADRLPAFAAGNVLVSLPRLESIAVVDLEREAIVWALSDVTSRQHDPAQLPNGNVLVFDNRTEDEGSRVIEVDPATDEIVWQYPSVLDPAFFSNCCGTAHRLENGNTLITMTSPGFALEVDPAGTVVWEFQSPHRVDDGRTQAGLQEVMRVPSTIRDRWPSDPQ